MKKLLLCFLFIVSITAFAQIQTTYPDYEVCDENNDGIYSFNLTSQLPAILGNLSPNDYTVTFHETMTAATVGANAIATTSNYINIVPNVQTIYIRIVSNSNNEITIATMNLVVNNVPIIDYISVTECLQNGLAYFDLGSVAESLWEMNGNDFNSISIDFYLTQTDAANQVNPIGYSYTTQDAVTTVFANVVNTLTGCNAITSIFLYAENCGGPICFAPINGTTTSVTDTTATIGWTAQGNETQWCVFVTPLGAAAPTETECGIQTAVNPFVLTGLNCSTTYAVYVRAFCTQNMSPWSSSFTFQTTACAPAVGVSTNYTVDQLVNQVLLNEDCAVATAIVSQGTCGIAYFNNNSSAFPFEQGMLLRSGNAILSSGPYTSSSVLSSTCSQLGDTDLASIINTSGQTGSVNDVSSVKFDFIATSNLLSFNFVFASNEYGIYQCQYSDVFGFILTDLTTGLKQNIAVVPGTTTPISTTTIRNALYNSTCTSVNPQFFGIYNENNPNSTIGFRGQTVPMTAFATVIPGRQYSLKLAVGDYQDSSFDSGVFIEGGSLAFGNQCQENIQLIAFVDENNNGIKDGNEVNYTQGVFATAVNGNPQNIISQSSNGAVIYFLENPTDVFDFSYSIYPELAPYFSTTASYSNVLYTAGGTNVYYFPVTNTQPYTDVQVSLTSIQGPRPGFTYVNKVTYKNLGLTAASGTLTYTKDNALSITNVSQAGTVTTATGFTYDYTNLMPNETRTFNVTLQVPTLPTVSLGQQVTNTASSANSGDINMANNTFELTQTIQGSYDPNDKMESHGGKIVFTSFDADDYLHYTIRFQNNGTANAQFVIIEDALDSRLDETSLRMVSASHNYTLTRVGNLLEWSFQQINLPPTIVDLIGSNGYVTFKIKVKPGFAVGDIIPNTASIFFDYNPAIVTNTFNTEFVQNLSTASFTNENVLVYPNPATSMVQIALNTTADSIGAIAVYDMLGKKVLETKNLSTTQTTLNTSSLTKGIYLIELYSTSNLKLVKKLVIQ